MIRGSVAADHHFAYFTVHGSESVYSYELNTEEWNELPPCPCCDSAPVIVNGSLITVGGVSESHYSDALYTYKERQKRWDDEYPPMNNARADSAVFSTHDSDYIVAIGGRSGGNVRWINKVELFQVKTRRWYELTNLPQPLAYPSATICGNQVHVIGGGDVIGYSCSLQALPSSDERITSQSIPHLISWTSLPPLPVTHATIATLCGQLVIIGGERDRSRVNSIHQLVDRKWVVVGHMTRSRGWCLSVSPSPDTVIVVGGDGAPESVEECVVVQ